MIYLVRHGESLDNAGDLIGGDSSLTEFGISQAEEVGSKLVGLGIEKIYCSALKRSIETASIISEILNVPIVKVPELNERNHGVWAGRKSSEFRENPINEVRLKDPYGFVFPGGESVKMLMERVRDFAVSIPDNSLVVGHMITNRCILAIREGREYRQDSIGNCEVIKI